MWWVEDQEGTYVIHTSKIASIGPYYFKDDLLRAQPSLVIDRWFDGANRHSGFVTFRLRDEGVKWCRHIRRNPRALDVAICALRAGAALA